jgi:hypothetical protein
MHVFYLMLEVKPFVSKISWKKVGNTQCHYKKCHPDLVL